MLSPQVSHDMKSIAAGPLNEKGRKGAPNPGMRASLVKSGSEKDFLLQTGSFQKSPFLEILENVEIQEILENRQTVENKGESNHFLEILEDLEILEILKDLEILELPPAKRPLS